MNGHHYDSLTTEFTLPLDFMVLPYSRNPVIVRLLILGETLNYPKVIKLLIYDSLNIAN